MGNFSAGDLVSTGKIAARQYSGTLAIHPGTSALGGTVAGPSCKSSVGQCYGSGIWHSPWGHQDGKLRKRWILFCPGQIDVPAMSAVHIPEVEIGKPSQPSGVGSRGVVPPVQGTLSKMRNARYGSVRI